MTWQPSPMSIRSFPRGMQELRIAVGLDQQISHQMQRFHHRLVIPLLDDPEHMAFRLTSAVRQLDDEVTRALVRERRVADAYDYGMQVEVRAWTAAWPAIPGITIPDRSENSMPDDAS